jgi:hypothetical protein
MPSAPTSRPKPTPWTTPPLRKARRCRATVSASLLASFLVRVAVRRPEPARDATAVAPPIAAAACSARDPRPADPASWTTDAVNRPSVTAETSWATALVRAAGRLPWKKPRIVGASEPGRGYGTSLRARAAAVPPTKTTPVVTPLSAARSADSCGRAFMTGLFSDRRPARGR